LQGSATTIEFPRFFSTLSCDSGSYSDASLTTTKYLSSICDFRSVDGKSAVYAYLLRAGGLLTAVPVDVNVGIRHDEMVAELSRIQKLLTAVVDELKQSNIQVFDSITAAQKDKLLHQIDVLQARLRSLDEAAKKSSGELGDILKRINGIGENLASGYTELAAEKWLPGAQHMYLGVTEFGRLLDGNFPAVPPEDRANLQIAIDQAKRALVNYAATARLVRDEMVASKTANLRELMEVRARIVERRQQGELNFLSLLRASIQDYLQTLSRAPEALKSNLDLIAKSLQGTSGELVPLKVQLFRDLCSSQAPVNFGGVVGKSGKIGCANIQQVGQDYVIVSSAAISKEFPVLVVGSGSASIPVSFGYVFDGKDLSVATSDLPMRSWRPEEVSTNMTINHPNH
jgi:hypothetical protein